MKEDFGRVRWITIDATGTLIDPYPSVGEVYRKVLARHGLDAPQPILQKRFVEVFHNMTKVPRGVVNEKSEYEFWKRLMLGVVEPWATGETAEKVFEDAYNAFALAENWRAPEGAEALLKSLSARGYNLALLSNADGRCRRILQDMGLAKYLKHILLSCEVGYEKPDIRLFKRVEVILGAKPEEILHVGDSQRNDGDGPRAADWNAVIIGRDIPKLVDLESVLG
jgi:putative hydrolase of the HAD superfamily